MQYDQMGKLLIGLGATVAIVGLLFVLFGRGNFLGRLPGDINFTSGNFTCVAPIASMLLLSVLLTIILNVVLRIFNR